MPAGSVEPYMIEVLIFVASLLSILAVSWLVKAIGLGKEARITSKEQAFAIADTVMNGFDGTEAAIDKAGYGALVRNAEGQQMLIRAHGSHFVGRLLDSSFSGRLSYNQLTLESAERTFGSTTLNLGDDAQFWTARLREVLN